MSLPSRSISLSLSLSLPPPSLSGCAHCTLAFPFLFFFFAQIEALKNAGVDHVVLAVNYRAEVMEDEMRKHADRVSLHAFPSPFVSVPYSCAITLTCVQLVGLVLVWFWARVFETISLASRFPFPRRLSPLAQVSGGFWTVHRFCWGWG